MTSRNKWNTTSDTWILGCFSVCVFVQDLLYQLTQRWDCCWTFSRAMWLRGESRCCTLSTIFCLMVACDATLCCVCMYSISSVLLHKTSSVTGCSYVYLQLCFFVMLCWVSWAADWHHCVTSLLFSFPCLLYLCCCTQSTFFVLSCIVLLMLFAVPEVCSWKFQSCIEQVMSKITNAAVRDSGIPSMTLWDRMWLRHIWYKDVVCMPFRHTSVRAVAGDMGICGITMSCEDALFVWLLYYIDYLHILYCATTHLHFNS